MNFETATTNVGLSKSAELHLNGRARILVTVTLPFCGLIAAIVVAWGKGIGATELALMLAMYLITALGVSLGLHRLFAHRSYKATRATKVCLAIAGSMAMQGPLFEWVTFHRLHHQRADREGDPHSPHLYGVGLWNLIQGAWHAHVGWLFHSNPAVPSGMVDDLRADRSLATVNRFYYLWIGLGLLIPALVGWFIHKTLSGFLLGLLWGGLVRTFLLHHVTWSINSACHIWGSRPYKNGDMSTNNFLFGFIAVGEGWHNNHHAFPYSARHGLTWWQFDLPYLLLRFLEPTGFVSDLRVPSIAAQRSKTLDTREPLERGEPGE
ncbi:MAG: acyl-CoA desaturase [Terriglobales bacterium]